MDRGDDTAVTEYSPALGKPKSTAFVKNRANTHASQADRIASWVTLSAIGMDVRSSGGKVPS